MNRETPTVLAKPRQPWSQVEDDALRSLCQASKMPTRTMAPILGRTIDAVRGRMVKLGIKSSYMHHCYTKDDAFFTAPNPLNAYYAGYIAADGSVNREEHCVRWSCQEDDVEALEGFKEATRYTGRIGFKLNVGGLGAEPSRQHFLDVYGARQWVADLERNFGVIPTKSHRLAPPNTRNDLLNACFILGYIDGDGSLSFSSEGNWTIAITSASPRVLEFVKAFCDRHFHPLWHSHYSMVCHYDQHYVYSIKGYRAIQLFDFLRSLPVPKLRRKWENPEILRVIAERKARRPDLFNGYAPLSFDESGMIRRHAQVESSELAEIVPLTISEQQIVAA